MPVPRRGGSNRLWTPRRTRRSAASCTRMVLKLADDVPIVWRTPTSLQLGIDAPRIVLDDVGAGDERLIAALRRGISPSGWSMLARDAGLTEERARAPARRAGTACSRPAGHRIRSRRSCSGDGPIGDAHSPRCCTDAGRLARPDERAPALWSLWSRPGSIGPEDAQHWLRRDVPHLPVVVGRSLRDGRAARRTGRGPVPLLRPARPARDADPAWPAIAAQLWGRPAPRLLGPDRERGRGVRRRRRIARLEPALRRRRPTPAPGGSPTRAGRSASSAQHPASARARAQLRQKATGLPALASQPLTRPRQGEPAPCPRDPDVEQAALLVDRRERRCAWLTGSRPSLSPQMCTDSHSRPFALCSVESTTAETVGSCWAAWRSSSSATNSTSVVPAGA